jgi:hypothetical protein
MIRLQPAMIQKKGRLPACLISERLLDELWAVFASEGEFVWNAVIGSGGDLMGKQQERPEQMVHDWPALKEILSSLPRIDQLQITVEYRHTHAEGTISLVFKNFDPAGGLLVVAGYQEAWVNSRFEAILSLLATAKDEFVTKLYGRFYSTVIHSIIPLAVSCIAVIVAAAVLIPGEIRRSEWIWWISVGTVVATLKLAQILSDRLVAAILLRYPYLRWRK